MKISKLQVPQPYFPRHPLWLMAYDAAWELLPSAIAQTQTRDIAWLMLWAKYAPTHFAPPSLTAADPAVRAWAEWEWFQTTGDVARLAQVFPQLSQAYAWRQTHRRHLKGLYWDAPLSASLSTVSREDEGGQADATAQQAYAAACLAQIAAILDQPERAQAFQFEHRTLCDLLNAQCWDARQHFYFDLCQDGSRSNVKWLANAWPLLAGATSTAQAHTLVKHLNDPASFRRVHHFPCLSAAHPRYAERGAGGRGAVWPPFNYAIIQGLMRTGWHELAARAADNHITTISQVYKETRTHWDNYMPDYIEPGSIAQPDFGAWAGLASVALLIETLLGLRVDAPQHTLHWRPMLLEPQGIEQLHVGNALVNLQATVSERQLRALEFTLVTTAPLTLRLITPHAAQSIPITDRLTEVVSF